METKEFTFRGVTFNGFAMLFFNLLLTIAGIAAIVLFIGYGDWRLIVGGPLLARFHHVGAQRGTRSDLLWQVSWHLYQDGILLD